MGADDPSSGYGVDYDVDDDPLGPIQGIVSAVSWVVGAALIALLWRILKCNGTLGTCATRATV